MKSLWAPWRMEYIGSEKPSGCLLCAAAGKGMSDGFYVLFTGKVSTVMLNRYPYNCGHLMVSPIRHVASLEDLTEEESGDLFTLLRASTAALKKTLNPEGFNVGMNIGRASGAGIEEHLHMHVVPRWNGDTNYMPVISSTKVMPEHLEETYNKLKPLFEGLH